MSNFKTDSAATKKCVDRSNKYGAPTVTIIIENISSVAMN